jgi:hypothetical protein
MSFARGRRQDGSGNVLARAGGGCARARRETSSMMQFMPPHVSTDAVGAVG